MIERSFREVYAELPQEARMRLAEMDYSKPERACLRGLTISELMREAPRVLTQGQWFEAQAWPAVGKFQCRIGSDID